MEMIDSDSPGSGHARLSKAHQLKRPMGLLGVTLVATAMVLGGAWLGTSLAANYMAPVLAIVLAIVAIGLVVLAGQRLTPASNELRAATFAAAFVGCLLVVICTFNGSFVALRFKSDQSAWMDAVVRAEHEASANPICSPPAGSQEHLPGIGNVDTPCAILPGLHNQLQVRFELSNSASSSGLVYLASAADLSQLFDQCVFHLDGPWWRYTSSSAGGCSEGYSFISGP
jgi:hypothetical protein